MKRYLLTMIALPFCFFFVGGTSVDRAKVSEMVTQNGKLYLIVFADTDALDTNESNRLFMTYFSNLATDVAAYTGLQKVEMLKHGSACTKSEFEEMLRELDPSCKDVVILATSMHGYNDGSSSFPRIKFYGNGSYRNNSFSIEEAHKILSDKPQRLLLTINQSCNVLGIPEAKIGNHIPRHAAPTPPSRAKYRKLFLEQKGEILITSSKKGQYTYFNDQSGYFLLALKKAFNEVFQADRNKPSWARLLQLINNYSNEFSSRVNIVQTPYYIQKVGKYENDCLEIAVPSRKVISFEHMYFKMDSLRLEVCCKTNDTNNESSKRTIMDGPVFPPVLEILPGEIQRGNLIGIDHIESKWYFSFSKDGVFFCLGEKNDKNKFLRWDDITNNDVLFNDSSKVLYVGGEIIQLDGMIDDRGMESLILMLKGARILFLSYQVQ